MAAEHRRVNGGKTCIGLEKPPVFRGFFDILPEFSGVKDGGAEGSRTPDLDIANVALSQLSYGPMSGMGCASAKRGG